MELKYILVWMSLLSHGRTAEIQVPGDMTIVGMFRIWQTVEGKCSSKIDVNSVMLAEAVKWYITQLNAREELPFTIGFQAFATCGLPSEAAKVTVDILSKATLSNETIIGIIGPELSSESRVVSSIVSSLPENQMLAQVGFSATNVLLGDNSQYPNFVRVVPNTDVEIKNTLWTNYQVRIRGDSGQERIPPLSVRWQDILSAMIQTMISLKWNRISIVFEENDYGRDGAERLQASAKASDICVSEMYPIDMDGGVDAGQVSSVLNAIVFGTDLRPSTSGIVLFSTSTTIHTIFLSMSALNVSPIPLVLVSDGLEMNVKELLRHGVNGLKIIPEAKGTMTVVPPYLEITEFSEHWNHVFTNSSSFQTESLSNPYINEVFKSIVDCDASNCAFAPLKNIETEFKTQPLYVQYAIVAAHALIKSLQTSLYVHCPSYSGVCSEFVPKQITNNLKGIKLDFSTDFILRLNSLSNTRPSWQIGATGELYQADDKPAYQLYNYQEVLNEGSTNFDLVQVGEYFSSGMNITYDKLRDYTGTGETKIWPDLRKAQCPLGTFCSECMPLAELQESVYFEPGDRYVVGIVPVYNTDDEQGCGSIRTYPGYQAAEVMKYSIESVNNKTGSFVKFFPGIKIGLIILNSCNNPVVTQRKIYNLHYNSVKLPNGEIFTLDIDNVIGYVGEVNSDITIGMAEVLTMLPFVQISYGSTSDRLSDRGRYPRFMRVVTPVTPQAKAIIELVKHTNSNYIQIVHSDTVYGNNGKDSIVQGAFENKICVIQKIPFREDGNEYEIYDKLRRFPHARMVIVFLQSYKILRFVTAILSQMEPGEFTFIGSQTWHHTRGLLDVDTKQDLLGSFSLAFEIKQDPRLLQRIRSLSPQPFSKDPWSASFLQARGNCYYDESFDKTQPLPCSENDNQYPLDYLDTYVYIATISLLTGANSLLHKTCPSDQFKSCPPFTENVMDLIKEIREVKLDVDGSGLEVYVFNDNNDGNIGFRVYNIQKDSTQVSKMVYVPVGRYSLDGKFDFAMANPSNKPQSSTCPNVLACKECDIDDDVTSYTEENTGIGITTTLGILLAIFGVIIIALIAVAVVLFRKCRVATVNDPYIRPTWVVNDPPPVPPPDHCPQQRIPTTDD